MIRAFSAGTVDLTGIDTQEDDTIDPSGSLADVAARTGRHRLDRRRVAGHGQRGRSVGWIPRLVHLRRRDRRRGLGRRQHVRPAGDLGRPLPREPVGEQGHRTGEPDRRQHRRPPVRLCGCRARELRGGVRPRQPEVPEAHPGACRSPTVRRACSCFRTADCSWPRARSTYPRTTSGRPSRCSGWPREAGVPGDPLGHSRWRSDRLGCPLRAHGRPSACDRLWSVSDSYYAPTKLFAIDGTSRPAGQRGRRLITSALTVTENWSADRRRRRRVWRPGAPAASGWRPRERPDLRTRSCCWTERRRPTPDLPAARGHRPDRQPWAGGHRNHRVGRRRAGLRCRPGCVDHRPGRHADRPVRGGQPALGAGTPTGWKPGRTSDWPSWLLSAATDSRSLSGTTWPARPLR